MIDVAYSPALPLRILIIDDTPADRLLVVRQIQQSLGNATFTEISNTEQFQEALKNPAFNFVITDYQLHWTNGLAVLDEVRAVCPECPVIMFTDSGDEELAVEAMRRGLDDYVPKNPKRHAPLSAAIVRVLRRQREQATIRALQQDQARINEALRLNEKFAELGRLAGVIAHEINNPLESIVNLLYLVREDRGLPAHLRSYVQTCEAELARIASITRQTLTFHRESRVAELTPIAPMLDSILAMFVQRVNARIQVERDYREPGLVLAYPSQLRQVFVNLISNALDAMQQNGGRLILRIRRSRDWTRTAPGAHAGEPALAATSTPDGSGARNGFRISIGDSGVGIDPANRRRLFQAFFTTKGEHGTGLGLWVTHEILMRHQGTIHVCSTNRPTRHGTVFSVFLPSRPNLDPR
jgi:two-component system, NtrC family, sensor kinase